MELFLEGEVILGGLLIILIWLISLTVYAYSRVRFVGKLAKGASDKDLVKVIKKLLDKEDLNAKDIEKLRKEVVRQENESFGHVQKLGVVRFNPFRETGGDHSFSLAILDGRNSGFVITGLHTRERTRLYLKEIIMGKSDTELSTEERKAFEKAQKYHSS